MNASDYYSEVWAAAESNQYKAGQETFLARFSVGFAGGVFRKAEKTLDISGCCCYNQAGIKQKYFTDGLRGKTMALKNLRIAELLDCYGGLLTDKQQRVLTCYYDEDFSLSEIAENEAITPQGVRDLICRAQRKLLRCEERLGLCGRLAAASEKAAQIAQLAQQVTEPAPIGEQIKLLAEQMLERG